MCGIAEARHGHYDAKKVCIQARAQVFARFEPVFFVSVMDLSGLQVYLLAITALNADLEPTSTLFLSHIGVSRPLTTQDCPKACFWQQRSM